MSARPLADMAGHLRVAPGAPVPHSLSSSRRDWASRVSAGQPVHDLPGLMAGLFSLCGHSHRICARLAIDAGRPCRDADTPPDLGERLRLETAQEHIRRIGLDWPRLLATEGAATATAQQAAASLAACPTLRNTSLQSWPALREWLRQHWLQMDPAAWLSGWCSGAGEWLHRWSQQHDGWLARLLRDARQADLPDHPVSRSQALSAHATPGHLRTLGAALALKSGFAQQPMWHGSAAHTGTWARLNTPPEQPALSPWAMLGCRIAELARLCLPGGATWLRWGALTIQPGQGLAWVEMARGLLVHQVTLSDDGATAQRCRVLAPTEWNFHPQGEVAQRLSALDPASSPVRQQVRLLMAAFDPCVPFEIAPPVSREAAHA